MEQMQRQVDLFNHGVKVGDPVTLRKDNGEIVCTTTASEAQILSGHTPVVWLDLPSNRCWHLDRVTPVDRRTAAGGAK